MHKKVFTRGSLRVELDKSQVFEDDPGQGTPALVISGEYVSTYWAAVGEGELLGDSGVKVLTDLQLAWLDSLEQKICEFLYVNS